LEIHKSANKTGNIREMTHALAAEEKLRAKEEVATPEIALQCLNETHQDLARLRAVRDALQDGNINPFLKLATTDYKEWVFNGKGPELPAINFKEMKLQDGRPDLEATN